MSTRRNDAQICAEHFKTSPDYGIYIQDIILHGSVAKDQEGTDSDTDLVFVFRRDTPMGVYTMFRLDLAEYKARYLGFDITCMHEGEIDRLVEKEKRQGKTSFWRDVKEGVSLLSD